MKKASIIMAGLACAMIAAAYTNSVPISTNTRAATEKWTAIRFEPALPPTPANAASKFLDGNREWQTVTAAQIGALTNELDEAALAALADYAAYWPRNATASSWFTYTTNSGAITITGYNIGGGGTDIVIPDYINGLPVTEIGANAFAESGVTSIGGAGNVVTVGTYAFGFCGWLTSVSLPQVQTVGGSAFYGCTSLASVSLPQVQTVGPAAFSSCASLASVSLPQVQTLGDYAFDVCGGLTSFYCDNDAPAIGVGIFENIIPNQVTIYVTNPQATGWGATFAGMPVVRLPLYADAITLNGDIITEWPVGGGGATNITDGVTQGTYTEATRTFDISAITGKAITNGMGGLLLAKNDTGAGFVRISGSGGGWGSALEINGSIYLSNWGANYIRFPSGQYVSGGVFYGATSEMGFKSWLGGEKWVIRSLGGNAYIDNGSLTVAGTNTAAVVRSQGPVFFGPTIGGRQAFTFSDGTNLFFVNVNYVTNSLTTN